MENKIEKEIKKIDEELKDGVEVEEGITKYIEKDGEEIFEVITKDGVFQLKEVEYDKLRSAIKRGKVADKEELCLLSELIIKKNGENIKIGEMELGKYKGSSIVRLAKAMNKLIDTKDFQV